MKFLFLTVLAAVLLAGCAKNTPDPTPTLTGDSWRLQSDQLTATPLKGGAALTRMLPLPAGAVKVTYNGGKLFSLDVAYTSSQSGYHFEGDYDFYQTGGTLTYQRFYDWHTRDFLPGRTVQVSELTAHRLVTGERRISADTIYVDVLTYTR